MVEFKEPEKFKTVKARLRIIARATAEDKFLLIAGIKQAGGLVAMSGQSVADAQSLKEADIGLCMGSGCQVAKDNADLVILDNDFASVYRAIKWGRAIFDNVRKFIQFQLTINIVICFFVLIHAATLGQSPLNVIQLLWLNLIMDVLGAIAICTEPPAENQSLSEGKAQVQARIRRKDRIITIGMWRTIVVQATWQLLVLLVLAYFGPMMFFEESFNLVTMPLLDKDLKPTPRSSLNTIIFNTLI